ncbi:hypothetical protein FH972_022790 [Carpinus fangiana]|uniref:ABC-type xenobiotic transporter n=1 Tax=Carpinus fangiana TaxID=176857 RepID=A0A5N6KTK8_9ROSI|nr:hypothetical protein FH972_022790 [Carpinus fangiana]
MIAQIANLTTSHGLDPLFKAATGGGVTMISLASIVFVVAASLSAVFLLYGLVHARLYYRRAALVSLNLNDSTENGGLYVDQDGTATKKTMEETSDRPTRILLVVSSLCSTLFATAWMFRVGHIPSHHWQSIVLLCIWIMVAVQNIRIAWCSSSSLRFELGLLAAASTATLLFQCAFEAANASGTKSTHRSVLFLRALQTGFGFVTFLCLLSLRRRPVVFRHGRPVDAQFSVSAASRYSYSWVDSVLKTAREQGSLNDTDLPLLDASMGSRHLALRFRALSHPQQSLWKAIIRAHIWDFIRQWTICVFESVALFGPQICLYRLLSLLEKRDTDSVSNNDLWTWAAALVVSKLLHMFLQNWRLWIGWGILCTNVRTQLIALIYHKNINQPDAKDLGKKKDKKDEMNKVPSTPDAQPKETDALLPKTDGSDEPLTSEPETMDVNSTEKETKEDLGVITLLGTDVERIANFAAENIDFLGSFVKGVLGATFLFKLLGVWSTLAGLSLPFLFSPLTKLAGDRYTGAYSRMMQIRDRKTHLVTEVLQGMRQIKFAAMEEQWQDVIMKVRLEELNNQWRLNLWATLLTVIWLSVPVLIGATSLAIYAWLYQTLTASVAFTALATFTSLEYSLSVIPAALTELFNCRVSVRRVEELLNGPDKDDYVKESSTIILSDATFCWPSVSKLPSRFRLRDLSLEFPTGKLSVVIGKTGSGKSLLLAGLAGQAEIIEGSIYAPRSLQMLTEDAPISDNDWILPSVTALVSQIPWIENASIEANIRYGLPMNRERYSRVLDACALIQDLDSLDDGDQTEVGATGINISGGQRWRLTLARALYSRAKTLLLDDIFSAVDSHVGAHILNNAILGPLCKDRTLIIATHHAGLLMGVASVVVRLGEDGVLDSINYPSDYRSSAVAQSKQLQVPGVVSNDFMDRSSQKLGPTDVKETSTQEHSNVDTKSTPRKFVEDEARQVGAVKFRVFTRYASASGGLPHWILVFTTLVCFGGLKLAKSYWVKVWTQDLSEVRNTYSQDAAAESHRSLRVYLLVYIGISLLTVFILTVQMLAILSGVIRASTRLFKDMTSTVFQAKLRWIDTVPTGRLLNRFIGDFALIDTSIGPDMVWCLINGFTVVTIISSALVVSPVMIVPVVALATSALWVAGVFIPAARGTRRLESTSKSPIYDLFNTTVSGLATIRTFGKAEIYISQMCGLIDTYSRTTYYLKLTQQWLALRQGSLGCVFLLCIVIILVDSTTINASMAGFALSFALEYSRVAEITIKTFAGLELDMNATERVIEYTDIETEDIKGKEVAASWPSKGKIEVENLEVAYAPGLDPVLKGISFTIEAGKRVGVVGRTGSGKSTLTLALFRFLDTRKGTISIDGIDTSLLRLVDLRSRLSIIPQDPVLFTGTLRTNLDPWKKHSDVTLLETLRKVHLVRSANSGTATPANAPSSSSAGSGTATPTAAKQANVFTNLSHPISRGGLNLSQGQRQLVCLARAILSSPRVMVLDEATSAVDMATDALIQRSIREEFRDSTLLVIAHRLSTVADFDKVLVLGDGRVLEYGSPKDLYRVEGGTFRGMCEGSGEKEALRKQLTE